MPRGDRRRVYPLPRAQLHVSAAVAKDVLVPTCVFRRSLYLPSPPEALGWRAFFETMRDGIRRAVADRLHQSGAAVGLDDGAPLAAAAFGRPDADRVSLVGLSGAIAAVELAAADKLEGASRWGVVRGYGWLGEGVLLGVLQGADRGWILAVAGKLVPRPLFDEGEDVIPKAPVVAGFRITASAQGVLKSE